MLPPTTERAALHTAAHVNDEIRRQTADNIRHYARLGPAGIERRLEELEREWDIERVLEANAATVALVGAALGFTVKRTWFALPAVVSAFLLQHALQGWCPPLALFRRLGFRTSAEIDEEKYTLKAIRGDFAGATPAHSPSTSPAAPEPMAHAEYDQSPDDFRPTH